MLHQDELLPDLGVGTSVELFTGGGGLAQAMHDAGFRHLLLNEFAKHACNTLRANAAIDRKGEDHVPAARSEKWPLVEGKVQDVDFAYLRGQVDVVAGGPPCQPFSLGGDHKGHEDDRNMFPELFKVVRQTRPKAVICENVRGLMRTSFKPYFDYILRELALPFEERDPSPETTWEDHDRRLREQLDKVPADDPSRYVVVPMQVNAADYGVPQVRHRVIIVAFRADLGITEDMWRGTDESPGFMPRPTHSDAALRRSIHDGTYWQRHKGVPAKVRREVAAAVADVPDGAPGLELLPWRTLRDALLGDPAREEIPLPRDVYEKQEHPSGKFKHHIGWPGAKAYVGHTPNQLDRPAKTVKAGVHGVPGGESVMRLDDGSHRYMTVREAARVMTFPDHWTLSGPRGEQMRQLGNAVPVLLGQRFAEAIVAALRSVDALPAS